ncbi:hypothetical protein BJ742DRAFT_775117 [Cladochytrium replicatum]|nr:hypothetical protein BJ742DRAFT_775117 [Cladochytrium replicatum]
MHRTHLAVLGISICAAVVLPYDVLPHSFSPKLVRYFPIFARASPQSGLPRLCQQISQYSGCQSNASLAQSQCNQLVSVVPTLEFQICLCDRLQDSLRCYALCPDDPQLQLQLSTQKASVSSQCKAVEDMKNQGFVVITTAATSSSSAPAVTMNATSLAGAMSTTTSESGSSTGTANGITTSSVLGSVGTAMSGGSTKSAQKTSTTSAPTAQQSIDTSLFSGEFVAGKEEVWWLMMVEVLILMMLSFALLM